MKHVAIIGAGLQARRRLQPILEDAKYTVDWVVDLIPERAKEIAQIAGAQYGTDWKQVVTQKQIDVVLVLTYPDSHAEISIASMQAGKDVLCEKPLTRTEKEAERMLQIAKRTKRILKCGFNHRHHLAVLEMYRLYNEGAIGKAVFGRGRYGIAGRSDIQHEWRSNPKIVSGGQFMELGIHLVDLYRWFLGDIQKVTGMVNTNHWPIAPLEDNAFAVLQNNNGVMVSIHASLTQWINLFEFELYGEKGSLCIQGLGNSYGNEKLVISQHEENKPFSSRTIEYRGADVSWKNEWKEFTRAVSTRKDPIGNGHDGLQAMKVANALYKSSKSGKTVKLQ
jgi:predicted dehydrogenase